MNLLVSSRFAVHQKKVQKESRFLLKIQVAHTKKINNIAYNRLLHFYHTQKIEIYFLI